MEELFAQDVANGVKNVSFVYFGLSLELAYE